MREMRQIRLKAIATKISSEGVVEEEPMSPGSRVFHEDDFNVHVLAIVGSKTMVDVDVIKANLPHTLLKHPRFSSVVVGDLSKGEELHWVRRAYVDPADHIVVADIHTELADNPDKYLDDYIYNLSKSRLDRSKPLWEIHVINLKTSNAEATTVFRIHHSLGDGTSLISLLLACTRQAADPTAVPTIPASGTHKRKLNNHGTATWWRMLIALCLTVELWWNTIVDMFGFFATWIYLNDTPTPLKGGPGLEYTPRRVTFKTLNLDDFKLIKKAVNGTINDVALGITQAGLSKYLNRKYGVDKNNMPRNIRLRSTLLINLRPTTGIQALADMMKKNTKAKWGNWIGFILLPFAIGLRDDPLNYIYEAKATIDRKKRSLEAICTFCLSEIALKLFGVKASGAMSHRVLCNTTLAFSNLVGPMEEIEFFGHPIQYLAPTSYGQPHELMINFQSYADRIMIVLSVDEDIIPDAPQLCNDIVKSLKLIKEEVIAKGLA